MPLKLDLLRVKMETEFALFNPPILCFHTWLVWNSLVNSLHIHNIHQTTKLYDSYILWQMWVFYIRARRFTCEIWKWKIRNKISALKMWFYYHFMCTFRKDTHKTIRFLSLFHCISLFYFTVIIVASSLLLSIHGKEVEKNSMDEIYSIHFFPWIFSFYCVWFEFALPSELVAGGSVFISIIA